MQQYCTGSSWKFYFLPATRDANKAATLLPLNIPEKYNKRI